MDNNKHITLISSLPPVIGLSPYTKELVTALSKEIKITVLGFNHIYPKFLYPGKLKDGSLQCPPENENLTIRNVLNWYNPFQWIFEAFKIDTPIIHAQWWSYPLAPIYWTLLGINRLRKKKIILTIHNVKPHERNLFKTFLNRCVFSLGDEYIVHTENNKEQLSQYVKNKPIHVIPHGIIQPVIKGISKDEAREILGIDLNDKILLCFGHIRDYKGLDTAIEALSLIDDETVKLMIAGKCWEDWDKYDQLIKKHRLEGRIILKLGFIKTDDIEPIFMASDLVLLPYKHFDAQSGVGALGLPFGIPMIVSDTGGLTDYVRGYNSSQTPHPDTQGAEGSDNELCVFEPGNAQQLSQKICEILENKQLYATLKEDMLNKKEELKWSNISQETIQKLYLKNKR